MKIFFWLSLLVAAFFTVPSAWAQKLDKNAFGEIKARHIGPAVMSGRISAIDALDKDPRIVYIGAAAGGVWKSKNAGTTFEPIFDDHIQSIGTITIDQQRPDTIWVGTGETWVRNSVSVGDGVYKTVNGGEKWINMGLKESERIAKIIIHPDNPDIVYVAAMGQLWSSSEQRGVFRTTDGGKSWTKVLYVDENTGCSDLAIDFENPDILYAAMWDYRRYPYKFRSGGPGSGLFRTIDGGSTWKKITEAMPEGMLGRIALTVSPANPARVWALIEAKKTRLIRSDDRGETWNLMTETQVIGDRPFYFAWMIADPVDSNRLYKPGFTLYVSEDGGKTFRSPFVGGGNAHGDYHPMYISKKDNNFIYMTTDGGLYLSHDKAATWKMCRNLPLSQFYRVTCDDDMPYNVYGGLQDNGSWYGPSRSPGGITNHDWKNVGYGDGFNVLRDRTDRNIIYWQYQGGEIKRHYVDTKEFKDIKPFQDKDTEKLRFNWNTPLVQGNSGALYVGSQYLYRSENHGDTWERISSDLTSDDPEKQKQEETGGLTVDNSSAENHCTIYYISESPLDKNLIWVGTDDGNVQMTNDGGKSWTNLVPNIPGLPANTWCSSVVASSFDKGTAFATFDGHRTGDMKPYVYRTTDFGSTWTSLADTNIKSFCHIIKQDPVNPDLIFLGTEWGLYISINGGLNWTRFSGKVPMTPVHDLVFQEREKDLVIGTHGRGILILDDITPLRSLKMEMLDQELVFLDTKPYILRNEGISQRMEGDDGFEAPNPSDALQITYYMSKRHVFGDMSMEIYDPEGKLIKSMPAGKMKGINRVRWNIMMKPPKVPSSVQILGAAMAGPTYAPGDYTVKILKGDKTFEGKVTIAWDENSRHTVEDQKLRYETLMEAYNLLQDLAYTDRQILDLVSGLKERQNVTKDQKLVKTMKATATTLEDLRNEILATKEGQITGEVRLRENLGDIYGGVMGYLGKPTDSQLERLDLLEIQVKDFRKKVDDIKGGELQKINDQLKKEGLKEITVTGWEDFLKEEQ